MRNLLPLFLDLTGREVLLVGGGRVAAGKLSWSAIRELGELVTGKANGRTSPSDLTLFKSLGIALEDVAFAELVYERALAAGIGRPI